MKESLNMDTKSFFEDGVVGYYSYCEVTQIILEDKKNKEYWNYFTHIDFSSLFQKETKQSWMTDRPISINDRFRVMITQQVLPAKSIINTVDMAVESQKWVYGEDRAQLDDVYEIAPRYIPETDPTGNIISENTQVPLERTLYGTNFSGNYYVVELFSSKRFFESVLTQKDRISIQRIIETCGLQYDLVNLTDRVGNIICKLREEVVEHKPLKLGLENGIIGRFSRGKNIQREIMCFLNITMSSDHTIIENTIMPFILCDESPNYEYTIEPNRCHNRITVVDQYTGVIYYAAECDYSFGSDYYSHIMPRFFSTTSKKRILKIDGDEKQIETYNLLGTGSIIVDKEIYELVRRQNVWKERERANRHYFQTFKAGEQLEAIATIIDIVNDKELFWDLEEIWLIDPYLSSKDILKTVVYCEKYGIKIKCLTSIGTINDNKVTQIDVKEDSNKFQESKKVLANELYTAIPNQTDFQLEFRTVRGSHGEHFHDRYLILKYGINKCRAWSLGTSVNALGTSHHIIQIIESPTEVADVFESIWDDTDNAECLIYSNWKK